MKSLLKGKNLLFPGAELRELKINKNYYVYILNIKEYSIDLKNYVDKYMVSICEGNSNSDLDIVKKEVLEFLKNKKLKLKMGAIAEFFVHLLLNTLKFKQECLFLNLEENSIKKGFDGYYSFDKTEWIMESKSGMSTSKNISHPLKIKEAYNDLKDKVSGKSNNNPWKNAYNHVNNINVNTNRFIRDNIKKLSDDYFKDNFGEIKDFNIIPASTIFLEKSWSEFDYSSLIKDMNKDSFNYTCNDMILICITKSSIDFLERILNE